MRKSFGIAVFILLTSFVGCKKDESGVKPTYRTVTEAVYSTVTVQPRESYSIYSKIPGSIDKVFVSEGDLVKKGDPLFKLADTKSSQRIQNAQLKYEIANEAYKGKAAVLLELEKQICNARAKMTNDSVSFERQKRLWKQNVGSKQDYDRKQLAYELTKNDLSRLTTMYERNREELRRQVEIAENTLTISKLDAKDLTVFAQIDGKVYTMSKEVGESISSQTVVGTIGSAEDFKLSLLVDEVDIRKVYLEQNVIVTLDAFQDETFEAKVSKIYPEKNERSLTFEVEAEFVTKPDRLFKGLSGEANIVIEVKSDVLTLPNQYINASGEVNTRDGLVPVKTGLKSLEFTEIVEGLDTSTVVKKLE